jgi:hypothetical protein
VQIGPFGNETSASRAFENLSILGMRERLEILRASFDRGRFDVGRDVWVMRFNEASVPIGRA